LEALFEKVLSADLSALRGGDCQLLRFFHLVEPPALRKASCCHRLYNRHLPSEFLRDKSSTKQRAQPLNKGREAVPNILFSQTKFAQNFYPTLTLWRNTSIPIKCLRFSQHLSNASSVLRV
jgi:hypothetical protein